MHIHIQNTSGNARHFPLPNAAAKLHKLPMHRGASLSQRELRRIVAEMLG